MFELATRMPRNNLKSSLQVGDGKRKYFPSRLVMMFLILICSSDHQFTIYDKIYEGK